MRHPLLSVILFSIYIGLCAATLHHGQKSLTAEFLIYLNYGRIAGYLLPIFLSFSQSRSVEPLPIWVFIYRATEISLSLLLGVAFAASFGYGYGISFMALALVQLLLTIRILVTRSML